MPGEFELIQWIVSQQRQGGDVVLAGGDDLAVMRWGGADLLLVGVDQALEGVHFALAEHSPRLAGRKVMNRNLSDCAAMACLPAAAVASVALPHEMTMQDVKELYLGMREAGEVFDCPIIGGETGVWDGKLAVTVAILGRSAGIEPVRRRGARAGDGIYVTGPLGGSLLGRHLTFTPRVREARQLAATGRLTAMIDLSDGLSRDLGHICADGLGALVDADQVPIHADATEMSRLDGRSALEHALHDGEDYELLVTAGGDQPLPGCVKVGTITSERGIRLRDRGKMAMLEAKGWEHRLDEK